MSEPIKNPLNLYTTGEIAKLCGVSVRTVQYYDTREILVPSSLTEGGRRLYSEAKEWNTRIILMCFNFCSICLITFHWNCYFTQFFHFIYKIHIKSRI